MSIFQNVQLNICKYTQTDGLTDIQTHIHSHYIEEFTYFKLSSASFNDHISLFIISLLSIHLVYVNFPEKLNK